MSSTKEGGFIEEASRTLRQGRPVTAREYLSRHSSNPNAPRTATYVQLMAVVLFLTDDTEEAEEAVGYLQEARGPDESFLDIYVEGLKALIRHKRPFWRTKRQHRRQDKVIKLNINRAAKWTSQLGQDGGSLRNELVILFEQKAQ